MRPHCRRSRLRRASSFVIAAACLAAGVLHASTPLRSPWDAQPVPVSPATYNCGPAIPVSPDISVSSDLDARNDAIAESVKSAAYSESTAAVRDFTRSVVSAADRYQHDGSQQAVECVAAALTNAAENHAFAGFMGSQDAWQQQNKALRGVSFALLKVRPSGLVRPDQERLILNWMNTILRDERHHYESARCSEKTCDLDGHRGLEVALASCSIGIAGNDHGLFHWCLDHYHAAVEHINEHGMLHYDMKGRYAFKFNLESAASLVQIAEFGETNGEPLYSFSGGRIHLLIHTVSRGLVDPSPFEQAARQKQLVEKPIAPWEVTWASVYDRRFPDPVITSLLQQIGPAGADMWGGEPWGSKGEGAADNQ